MDGFFAQHPSGLIEFRWMAGKVQTKQAIMQMPYMQEQLTLSSNIQMASSSLVNVIIEKTWKSVMSITTTGLIKLKEFEGIGIGIVGNVHICYSHAQ